ncbi:MAG: CHAT domain-containing protein [Bacteroidetes bacterium]|nr:CHAT domain-containing protein [Bacteroidota bacterium]
MKKIILYTLSFLFCFQLGFSQSSGTKLLQEGIQLYQQNKGKEAIDKLTEAGVEFKNNNEWGSYATCQCGLANILSGYQLFDKANTIFNTTLPIIEKNLAQNDPKLATCYLNKAIVELNQKNFTIALKFLHKGFSIRKSLYTISDNQNLEVVSLLSKIHTDLNNSDSSIFYSSILEKELINRQQGESLSMADVYNTKGNAYDIKKDYTNAILYHSKSLSIREKTTGSASGEVAYSLGNLALAYQSKGDYENAERNGLKGYEIRKKLFGPNDEQTQLSVFNMASLYSEMQEWKKAMLFYELQKNYIGKSTIKSELADYKLNYGTAQILSEQNLSEGIENLKEAATLYSSSKEPHTAKLATCYQNLTVAYTDYADYEQAKLYNERSAGLKKQLGISDPESQINAGNIFFYQGNTTKAIYAYSQALTLYEKKYGYGHHKHITAIENIAEATTKINAAAARQVYKGLLEIYKNDELKQANVFTRIGSVYLVYSQFDTALIFYDKAKLIYKKKNDVAGLVTVRNHEGVLAMGQNNFAEAEKIFSEVIKLNENKKNSYFNCKTHSNLALVQYEQKLFDKAIQSSKNAIAVNVNTNGHVLFKDEYVRSKKILFKATAKLALIKKNTTDLKTALTQYNDIKNASKEKETVDEFTLKMGTRNDEYKLNVIALMVCYNLFQNTKDETYLYTAAQITEDCKSVMIKKALKDINCKKLSGVPQDLIVAERKTIEECEQLAQSLNINELTEEDGIRFSNKLKELYAQEDSIKLVIKNKYPKYDQLRYAQNSDTKSIQQKLAAHEAIINFIYNAEFSAAIIISNKRIDLVELKNDKSSEENITAYRDGITGNDYKIISDNAYGLYKNMFSGVDSVLKQLQIKKITIVPDGPLFFFPFESMVKTKPKTGDNFSSLDYLIKYYEVNYLYAASLVLTQDQTRSTASKDYIAIAPVFSEKNEVAQTRNIVFKSEIFGKKKRSFLADGTYINPLPGTLEEVDAVSKHLNDEGQKCTVLKFNMANEKNIKDANLQDYKIIHFATHGFVNEDKPNFSGLILAQNGDTEDNILFASEIYNLTLNADLVALSACQTGLGTVSEGEGLIGLSRGFMYAGAKNLLVSLWPVSDEGTSTLMVDFFSNPTKTGYSSSLQRSKLSLIANPDLASPFYWAPFILIGK